MADPQPTLTAVLARTQRERDRATDLAERAIAQREEARGALRLLLASLSGEGRALEAVRRAWEVLGC